MKINISSFRVVFIILILGQFFQDILVIELNTFYIRTYKVALLISVFFIIKKYKAVLPFPKLPLLIQLTEFFLLIQTVSLFYSYNIAFSEKINYVFYNLSSIFIMTYLYKFLKDNPDWINTSLILLLKLMLVVLFIFFIGQLLGFSYFQNFKLHASEKILGVFYERLFFCEFLIIITVFIVSYKKITGWKKSFILTIVSAVVLLSGSNTGMFGLFSFVVLYKFKMKNIFQIFVLITVFTFFVWPFVSSKFLSENQLKRREVREERYYGDNMIETNWRILSSYLIIEDFINHPTLLGHGFRDNAFFLKPYYWDQDKDAFGASHTFISILRDQGIVGMIIFILIISILFRKMFKLLISNMRKPDKYFQISFVFSFLLLLRLLFYYQSVFLWHYLIAIVLISYYSPRKNFKIDKKLG